MANEEGIDIDVEIDAAPKAEKVAESPAETEKSADDKPGEDNQLDDLLYGGKDIEDVAVEFNGTLTHQVPEYLEEPKIETLSADKIINIADKAAATSSVGVTPVAGKPTATTGKSTANDTGAKLMEVAQKFAKKCQEEYFTPENMEKAKNTVSKYLKKLNEQLNQLKNKNATEEDASEPEETDTPQEEIEVTVETTEETVEIAVEPAEDEEDVAIDTYDAEKTEVNVDVNVKVKVKVDEDTAEEDVAIDTDETEDVAVDAEEENIDIDVDEESDEDIDIEEEEEEEEDDDDD